MAYESGSAGDRCWRFGNAVLDERSWQLRVNGVEQALERKAFELLRYLVLNAGRAMSKGEILEAVWPGRLVGETSLTKCVGRLRKVLGDADEAIVRTVHGKGYRLDVPVMLESAVSPPLRPPCRVLFVEDHELFRAGLKLLLASVPERMEFVESRCAADALERASSDSFDLIVLDLGLPGQPTGLEALRALRQGFPFANLVVMSASEDPAVVRSAIRLGAAAFIPKTSSHAVMTAAFNLVLSGGSYVPPYVILDEARGADADESQE
jgi:DNA-binding response OmpR family regulator